MHIATPKSTDFLQELAQQPIFSRGIDEQLKHEPFFQSQDFNPIPILHKQRVSQKLLENRLRRIQINMQKKQQVESQLEKKRAKERQIESNIRNRLEFANRKKEENLRQSHSQQENRKRGEQYESRQKLRRFQANLEKIEKGRCKAEEKRTEYIFRIHQRTEQNKRKVNQRRKLMQSIEDTENDQIHLQEWNNYKQRLIRKYEGRQKSPPDHLYQDFKQRNQKLKNILSQTNKTVCEPQEKDIKEIGEKEENANDPPLISSSSAKSLVLRSQRAEYFGIHEQNMMTKAAKEIQKMRVFLQNEGVFGNLAQNEEVYMNFKGFFESEILFK